MRLRWIPNTDLYIIIYSIFVAVTLIVLIYLREVRLDVYLSLYILEYYILRALISPLPIKINRRLRITDFSLFVIFSIIVAYRVLLIIAPGVVMGWLP